MRTLALVAIAALLTGCGGGGSMPGVVTRPLAQATAQPSPKAPQDVSVSFTIIVPTASGAHARRVPNYVSASTKSATIAVGSATPTIVNCTTTCSGTVSAPVGSDTFTVNLYDATNAGGSLLSTGTLTQTIVANTANSVNVTFNGVVASLAVAIANVVSPGTAGSVGVTANALDADGNTIVGPGVYVNASGTPVTIALSDSDSSGNSSLSQTSITQPTSGIELNYTSAFDTNPTISAAASGFTTANATVHFPTPTLTALSTVTGVAGNTVSETVTGTNFVSGNTTVAAGANVTVNSVNVTSSTTLTASFVIGGGATFGTRNVSATTGNGTSGTFPFAVGTSSLAVTLDNDGGAGTPAGTGTGSSGDLRSAIWAADATTGIVITFNCGSPCTITLNGPLPPMTANMIIDGGAYGRVVINGNSTYRAFWAESGTVVLANLEIENALAQGGNGGAGGDAGGGGGAGLGAALFVDTATVSAIDDYFLSDNVAGGNGGDGSGAGNGSVGGGGLGGNGGGTGSGDGSGGGGGILGAGAQGAGSYDGGAGGVGFANVAAVGADSSSSATPATPATAGYGGGGGGGGAYTGSSSLTGGSGGNGGFGGGGGGGGVSLDFGGNGGNGGFGGGGGGGGAGLGNGGNGGNGGPGGGGGSGGVGIIPGTGGALATIAGGSGYEYYYGGGGAAAGPAIFVSTGTLTTTNSGASGCAATGGAAGGGGATAGGSDATPVFNYSGTVNGSTTAGPVASALGSSVP